MRAECISQIDNFFVIKSVSCFGNLSYGLLLQWLITKPVVGYWN